MREDRSASDTGQWAGAAWDASSSAPSVLQHIIVEMQQCFLVLRRAGQGVGVIEKQAGIARPANRQRLRRERLRR